MSGRPAFRRAAAREEAGPRPSSGCLPGAAAAALRGARGLLRRRSSAGRHGRRAGGLRRPCARASAEAGFHGSGSRRLPRSALTASSPSRERVAPSAMTCGARWRRASAVALDDAAPVGAGPHPRRERHPRRASPGGGTGLTRAPSGPLPPRPRRPRRRRRRRLRSPADPALRGATRLALAPRHEGARGLQSSSSPSSSPSSPWSSSDSAAGGDGLGAAPRR